MHVAALTCYTETGNSNNVFGRRTLLDILEHSSDRSTLRVDGVPVLRPDDMSWILRVCFYEQGDDVRHI